jgi:RNA polymerase-binding transcription factor DksA
LNGADEADSLDGEDPEDFAASFTTFLSEQSLFRRKQEIDAALARMRNGMYGICVACGDDISLGRLKVIPWAQCCLRCQMGFEEQEQAETREPRESVQSFERSQPI